MCTDTWGYVVVLVWAQMAILCTAFSKKCANNVRSLHWGRKGRSWLNNQTLKPLFFDLDPFSEMFKSICYIGDVACFFVNRTAHFSCWKIVQAKRRTEIASSIINADICTELERLWSTGQSARLLFMSCSHRFDLAHVSFLLSVELLKVHVR